MKIFCGIILLIISTYLGYSKSYKYKIRENFYNDFLLFINSFISELSFSKNSLKIIIESNTYKEEFNKVLERYKENMSNVDNLLIDMNFLSEDEKYNVLNFFKNIGKSDSKSQREQLISYRDKISDKYKEKIKDRKKYGLFYTKIGALIGVCLLIMVI